MNHSPETLRMQFLSGIITEGEYKQMLNESFIGDAFNKLVEFIRKNKKIKQKIIDFYNEIIRNNPGIESKLKDTANLPLKDRLNKLQTIIGNEEETQPNSNEEPGGAENIDEIKFIKNLYNKIKDSFKSTFSGGLKSGLKNIWKKYWGAILTGSLMIPFSALLKALGQEQGTEALIVSILATIGYILVANDPDPGTDYDNLDDDEED